MFAKSWDVDDLKGSVDPVYPVGIGSSGFLSSSVVPEGVEV